MKVKLKDKRKTTYNSMGMKPNGRVFLIEDFEAKNKSVAISVGPGYMIVPSDDKEGFDLFTSFSNLKEHRRVTEDVTNETTIHILIKDKDGNKKMAKELKT